VWDDVSFSPRNYGYGDADVERMTREALGRAGIQHLSHKVCHHLSGGERRKVALAGALVLQPELLVLDEPFEGLDPASRADLVSLLNQLHQEHGVTLVMATHDVNVVSAMADVVYVLVGGGEIVAHGSPHEIFRDTAVLRNSNIEPPVLAELFERLEASGVALGRPLSVGEAAKVIVEWGGRLGPARPTGPGRGGSGVPQEAGARSPATPRELPFLFTDDEPPADERSAAPTRERPEPRTAPGEPS
jgi:cobalt/nickel transport system ATP-binding protein